MRDTLTLGELINALLDVRDHVIPIRFDFPYQQRPTVFDSWRGFYNQLALGHEESRDIITVEELIAAARACVNAEFFGYKGGVFRMDEDTPVWVNNHGDYDTVAITGVSDYGYVAVITTSYIET